MFVQAQLAQLEKDADAPTSVSLLKCLETSWNLFAFLLFQLQDEGDAEGTLASCIAYRCIRLCIFHPLSSSFAWFCFDKLHSGELVGERNKPFTIVGPVYQVQDFRAEV